MIDAIFLKILLPPKLRHKTVQRVQEKGDGKSLKRTVKVLAAPLSSIKIISFNEFLIGFLLEGIILMIYFDGVLYSDF